MMAVAIKRGMIALVVMTVITFICSSSSVPAATTHKTRAVDVQPRVVSLRLIPDRTTLWGAESRQRLLVMAKYSDGLERDVTNQSDLVLSDSKVAKIDDSARVLPVASGETELSASFGGQTATSRIRTVGTEEKRPFSFARDVGGFLTRNGCNSSDCHGSVRGKGGLKLSTDALSPREDYQWIVQGGVYQVLTAESPAPKVPRIDLKNPEKSLLLLKPTMQVAHGGGMRIKSGSPDYETVLAWVRKGAPYGEEGPGSEAVTIKNVEVFPREAVLDRTGMQQLLVTAHLSNGRVEDITDEVLYVSNNPNVVDIGESGLVKAKGMGETAVMVRAAGHPVSASVGVIARPLARYPSVASRNFIDEHVFAKLRRFNIIPSELSSDAEFLRRICLDLTGTLPPPERVRQFLDSKDARKRDKLIELLLSSPEYVDYWTYRFGEFLRLTTSSTQDLEYTQLYGQWIRNSIAENKPYDQIARERIAAQGYYGPASHFWTARELTPLPEIITEQVRVFQGRRLGCAQCHNHPYDSWTQDQFWGMAAFYGRMTKIDEIRGLRAPIGLIVDDAIGYKGYRRADSKVLHPRTRKEVEPRFLDGTELPQSTQDDLRLKLAEWMTSPQNPYFAEAIVNRVWGCFFSRGIVDPVDDFRATNPPTHPELLTALARDFVEHGYDLKHLIRLIVQSRTYQLAGKPNDTNPDDTVNYSHSLPRSLEPPVLLDAISHATGIEPDFVDSGEKDAPPGAPRGLRAIQLLPEQFPSRFLEVYGLNDRRSMPDEKPEPNLKQALHLLVGPTYAEKLSKEGSRLDRLLQRGAQDREIIDDLYLAALTRLPTREEQAELQALVRASPSRRQGLESLMWAVISSREFVYNR